MKRTHPELHGFGDMKVYRRAYWQKRGRENVAAGLTWNGEPRKRQNDLPRVHGTKRHVIRNQQRAEKFIAQGLTWRGTPRKRGINLLTPLEADYRLFRAHVKPEPATNWEVVER